MLKSPTTCWTCGKEGHRRSKCPQSGGAPKKDESSGKKVNMIQGGKPSPIKMKMGRSGPTIQAQLGERMINLLVDSRATGCFVK
ncbi:MAG: zinc finger domain-containing protein [Candidatus Paracaedibacteraceae bacterium]|nr:zinc finger domain-containing protein [Candidatus Paracaedibacteraceae bacterium]